MVEESYIGFSVINILRKEALINYYKENGYKVNVSGFSFGFQENMISFIYEPSLLSKIDSAFLGLNYLHAPLKDSLRPTGGILTEKQKQTYTGNKRGFNNLLQYVWSYIL